MHEYVTRAVVLDKETRNDADARYSFFTERFGKVLAKATSSRKIVSKLAGHLEPGTAASVRIIEQRGTKVVDALAFGRVSIPIAELSALGRLLAEWEPEEILWQELAREPAGEFSWTNALAVLGWDPRGAACTVCGRAGAGHFLIPRQEFFCAACASRFRRSDLILIS